MRKKSTIINHLPSGVRKIDEYKSVDIYICPNKKIYRKLKSGRFRLVKSNNSGIITISDGGKKMRLSVNFMFNRYHTHQYLLLSERKFRDYEILKDNFEDRLLYPRSIFYNPLDLEGEEKHLYESSDLSVDPLYNLK